MPGGAGRGGIEGDGEGRRVPVVGVGDGVSGGLHAEDIQVAGVRESDESGASRVSAVRAETTRVWPS